MPDTMTPEQRSRCMSRIRSKDTTPERMLRSALHQRGLRFRKHVAALPGSPDIVFTRAKVAVFVNGDFWHGYRFRRREARLSDYWRQKIKRNRARDAANFRTLRAAGWRVVRVWEHEVKHDTIGSAERISRIIAARGI